MTHQLVDINGLSRLVVAAGTLYNWVNQRRIPFIKAGRCLRFDYDAVYRALRECPMQSGSEEARRV